MDLRRSLHPNQITVAQSLATILSLISGKEIWSHWEHPTI
jgi:hypothetical protein